MSGPQTFVRPGADEAPERAGLLARSPAWLIVVVLIATIVTFVASFTYSRQAGSRLDDRATSIATIALPAIEHLSTSRGELLHLELRLVDALDRADAGIPVDRSPFETGLSRVNRELSAYSVLPFFSSETPRYQQASSAIAELEGQLDDVLDRLDAGDSARARVMMKNSLSPAINRADDAIAALVALNAEHARRLGASIPQERVHARNVRYALDGLTLVLAILLVALVLNSMGQKRSTERRAHDLAEFSSRLQALAQSSVAISDAITSSRGIDAVFGGIANQACLVIHASRCALRVSDPDGAVVVASSLTTKEDEESAPGSKLRVPVLHHGVSIGELEITRAAGAPPFSRDDARVAELLASGVGVAIHSARLYNEAHAATRAREDLLATVSHDLRGPLNAIRMATAILREHSLDRCQTDELVMRIDRSAQQMGRLIGDLLDAARIEAGRLISEPQAESVQALVDEALEMIGLDAARRSVALSKRVPPVTVLCERHLVLRVLSNLLGNALKFSSPGGRVSVTAELRNHEVEVAVSDTGIGMSDEDLMHVFDRYWQRGRSDRRGSGLGLFIARGIVEAHGGRIWAESTLGEGTTFRFTLPRPPRALQAPALEQRA